MLRVGCGWFFTHGRLLWALGGWVLAGCDILFSYTYIYIDVLVFCRRLLQQFSPVLVYIRPFAQQRFLVMGQCAASNGERRTKLQTLNQQPANIKLRYSPG